MQAGGWTPDEVSSSGQVFEFRLWALLTEQSRGALHVFLPLADRGIDALVHRLSDGAYIPIQAKGRSSLMDGEVHIAVWAGSLRDDDALLVAGLVVDGGLGPTLLVIPEGEFKRLAYLTSDRGSSVYSAEFGMHPRSAKWKRWLVPAESLAGHFGIVAGEAEPSLEASRPEWRSDLGFLGESEVVRLLASCADLNLFRPFPDLETAEIAVVHQTSRRVIGLQVKTVDVEESRPRATVNIHASSFRPSASTYFVVLAYRRDVGRFHEEGLLMPSAEIASIAHADNSGHLYFDFRPDASDDQLNVYRIKSVDLAAQVIGLLGESGNVE